MTKAAVVVTLAFAAACLDQSSPSRVVGLRASETPSTGGDLIVRTPWGSRIYARDVHLLPSGHGVRARAGHHYELDASGTVVADYGPPTAVPPQPQRPPQRIRTPSAGYNWVTWASWNFNPSEDSLISFSTNLTVPELPAQSEGQLVFLFNGLQDQDTLAGKGCCIVQPVLQYGSTTVWVPTNYDTNPPAPGHYMTLGHDNSWVTECWYVYNDTTAFVSTPIDVRPGNNLWFSVSGNPDLSNPGYYVYPCQVIINGGPQSTGMAVTRSRVFYQAVEALEGFPPRDTGFGLLTECLDYPTQTAAAMTNISIQVWGNGSWPSPLAWDTATIVTNCGQHTYVADALNTARPSPGEVDLYINDPLSVSLGEPYGSGTCLWVGGLTQSDPNAPFIYTWTSSDFGTFQVDTSSNPQDTVGWYDPYIPPAANVTVSVGVTDALGVAGASSNYVAGYDCPGGGSGPVRK